MLLSLSLLLAGVASVAPQASASEPAAAWTVMFYGATANSAEESFVPDMEAFREASAAASGMQFVFLVDRMEGFSASSAGFGEDFVDARLYAFQQGRAVRQDGGDELPQISRVGSSEVNTGDAEVLRDFVRWTRAHYPAQRYALVFYSHGGGFAWCPDNESGDDELYVAEVTDVLEARDSVDLVVFDVCLMAGVENAYQWRPKGKPGDSDEAGFGVDVMVATPNAGFPFPWGEIVPRLRPGEAPAGEGAWLDPRGLSALDFGRLVVEETERSRHAVLELEPGYADEINGEAQACFDLTRAADVKEALDALARRLAESEEERELVEALRGFGDERPCIDYFVPGEPSWRDGPYFDLFDLARLIQAEEQFEADTRALAATLAEAVDGLVVASFGLARYPGFEAGRHGAYVVFPSGDWEDLNWYHPGDARRFGHYGGYRFCADGATPGDGVIDNWFELLDLWYDEPDAAGGVNGYAW